VERIIGINTGYVELIDTLEEEDQNFLIQVNVDLGKHQKQ